MQESIEVNRTELEERLILATDSAKAYIWHLEIDSGRIWTTAKAKEFFGFALNRELDLESFLNIVHPEDREKLRLTVEEAMRSGEDNAAEYRIVRPEGGIRWVLSRARSYPASTRQSACLIGVSIDMTASARTHWRITSFNSKKCGGVKRSSNTICIPRNNTRWSWKWP